MSYLYVKDIYDEQYCMMPPPRAQLGFGDIPEEELEIREILECWCKTGLTPFIDAQLAKHNYWPQVRAFSRLSRLSRTLDTLFRYRAYYSAAKRIISLREVNSLEKQYLDYLLTKHST
ncbi:hypothetical protein ACPV4B_14410 [Vibrio parahaemolyticus]|uniref:hypothetical protein n=1 Tax=Vibrio mediterranei TaxID=689 RepID=UPI00406937EA